MKMSPKPNRSTSSAKRRLFLVEDHPVTREGFAQLINYQADLEVCGQEGTAARAIAEIERLKPDLVIVDLSLAESNGLELIKDLKSRLPALPLLVLSTHDESLYAERAVRAGALGYVMKQAPTSEVMSAIRATLRGEVYLSETMRTRLVHKQLAGGAPTGVGEHSEVEALSDRELEVFELLGHGHTTRKIAARLHLSVSTVETHRAHIKSKLKLSNALDLVRSAVAWINRQA
jgi:DNA-binding NarL/FixJ family response regulator